MTREADVVLVKSLFSNPSGYYKAMDEKHRPRTPLVDTKPPILGPRVSAFLVGINARRYNAALGFDIEGRELAGPYRERGGPYRVPVNTDHEGEFCRTVLDAHEMGVTFETSSLDALLCQLSTWAMAQNMSMGYNAEGTGVVVDPQEKK